MLTDRAKKRIPEIMKKFPSQVALVERPVTDKYGSHSGTYTSVGTFDIWTEGVNRPDRFRINDRAQLPVDTDMVWAAILRSSGNPQVRHGDRVTLSDGTIKYIRAMVPDGVSAREFWLLSEG